VHLIYRRISSISGYILGNELMHVKE